MKPIAESFYRDGFEHKLIERNGAWAIFKRWKRGSILPPHYEVVRIQAGKARTFPGGKKVEAAECYASSQRWGIDGFTCDSLERACEKLQEMLAKPKKGKKK